MNSWLYNFVVILGILKCTLPLPFIPDLSIVCTGGFLICFVWSLLIDKQLNISTQLLAFVIIAFMGILIKQPPAYYRSVERLLMFVINIAFLSPLFISPTLLKLRRNLFGVFLISIKCIVIASFIAYLLGINMANKSIANDVYWGFGGITSQSMLLAPCCAICFLEYVWKILFRKDEGWYKYLNWLILLISLWLMFAAGSRGCIMATVCALFPLVYYYKQKQTFFIRLFLIVAIAILTVPQKYYDQATYSIARKQLSAQKRGSVTSSRDEKWTARWEEFKEEPILGVGFASQTHFSSDDILWWIQKTGGLEPGSSWLAVLAMTGICGFLALLAFNLRLSLELLYKYQEQKRRIYMLAVFIFFIIHGMIEGWILYAGNFVFFAYWLFMGNINEVGISENKNN